MPSVLSEVALVRVKETGQNKSLPSRYGFSKSVLLRVLPASA
jgi:hypothetical protein